MSVMIAPSATEVQGCVPPACRRPFDVFRARPFAKRAYIARRADLASSAGVRRSPQRMGASPRAGGTVDLSPKPREIPDRLNPVYCPPRPPRTASPDSRPGHLTWDWQSAPAQPNCRGVRVRRSFRTSFGPLRRSEQTREAWPRGVKRRLIAPNGRSVPFREPTLSPMILGGEQGIRTLGELAPTPDFES